MKFYFNLRKPLSPNDFHETIKFFDKYSLEIQPYRKAFALYFSEDKAIKDYLNYFDSELKKVVEDK